MLHYLRTLWWIWRAPREFAQSVKRGEVEPVRAGLFLISAASVKAFSVMAMSPLLEIAKRRTTDHFVWEVVFTFGIIYYGTIMFVAMRKHLSFREFLSWYAYAYGSAVAVVAVMTVAAALVVALAHLVGKDTYSLFMLASIGLELIIGVRILSILLEDGCRIPRRTTISAAAFSYFVIWPAISFLLFGIYALQHGLHFT